MNFAVIEYSSKSGGIWRHTDTRPNYLADPAKEIDPTSFGCYVSALRGEHIPITHLIGAHRLSRRLYRRLAGHWPQHYRLDYLRKFDAVLVVHDIGNGPTVTAFTIRLRHELPRLVILGVPTQPYGIIKRHWEQHPAWLADLRKFMSACDVFLTIVRRTAAAWQRLTDTAVVYLPQPYPVPHAKQHTQSLTAKKPLILVAGVTERDNIRRGHRVASRLQQQFPDHLIHVIRTPGAALDTSLLAGTRFAIEPFSPWQRYLPYLSRVKLVINTDYTFTRGRVQADCAAVGTPSIGADSDGQADLFPDLPASRLTPLSDLVRQGTRLLTDPVFYQAVTATAQARLRSYDYPSSARRLTDLIASLRRRGQRPTA